MKELDVTGMAYIGAMCSRFSFALVDISSSLRFVAKYIAGTVAHELSHILGGNHISNQLIATQLNVNGACACHHLDEKYCVLYPKQIITI
ncbi:hypothetical protein HZS_3440 [Henneguya salminicola]|nr:hypothetical protein HZS_3440 [Henneguya salminicola]